jgi:endonuclease YncB( thermonuclease family)
MLTLTLAFALALPGADPAQPFTGKVVKVADGDTITVLAGGARHRVRLAGIDAPEKGQPFGRRAWESLDATVCGKVVKVAWKKRDRYGRILGEVYLGEYSVNLEMVRSGYARHYRQFSSDKDLAEAERAA